MSATTTTLTRIVGQRVMVSGTGRFDGPARIEKMNPKNFKVRMERTNTILTCPPEYMTDLTEDAEVPTATLVPYDLDRLPHQALGAVVKTTSRDGLWVVIADKGERINCARLGGDADRYVRFPRQHIQPVDPAALAQALADAAL